MHHPQHPDLSDTIPCGPPAPDVDCDDVAPVAPTVDDIARAWRDPNWEEHSDATRLDALSKAAGPSMAVVVNATTGAELGRVANEWTDGWKGTKATRLGGPSC